MQSRATNFAEAASTLRAHLSPRQMQLDELERFAAGTQYSGRADWFAENDTPLWERAPCIVSRLASSAMRSHGQLVLGESRFPAITSSPGEDDSEAGGLDEAQSKRVDRAIAELQKVTRYRKVARQALRHSQEAKSVATIVGVRKGRPFLELVRSRWCATPEFDAGRITRLEIRYPYVVEEKQSDGAWKMFVRLYRRVIDDKRDVTYKPLPAEPNGREPEDKQWQEDETLSVDHGLGFCPVHWYAHMRECTTVGDVDGHALHEEALDEIRGLDFALSQRHRAVLFAGDPQIVEIGVEPGYNPSGQTGRSALVPATAHGGSVNAANPQTASYVDSAPKATRRKSPGIVWQYESPLTKVEFLTLEPDAVKALDDEAHGLRVQLCEEFAYVPLDPENVKFAATLSGKAIEALRARQFDHCDEIRDDFGCEWLLPVMLLLIRVALATDVRSAPVAAVRDVLEQYVTDDAAAPMLFIRWPARYVRADAEEENVTISAVATAKREGVATLRMCIEKVAPIFGITNVDQAVKAIEQERDDNQKRAQENAAAMTKAAPPKPGDETKKPAMAAPTGDKQS